MILTELPEELLIRIFDACMKLDCRPNAGGLDVACKFLRRVFLESITSLSWPEAQSTECERVHLAFAARCKNITSIEIKSNNNKIDNISVLTTLLKLERLNISRNHVNLNFPPNEETARFEDISPLSSMTCLRELIIDTSTLDISPLSTLTNIRNLEIIGTHLMTDISPLSRLTGLQVLRASGLGVVDISPLTTLTDIRMLTMMGLYNVADISPLSTLTGLQTLDMCFGFKVADISPLSTLTGLQTLVMSYCTHVADISPLSTLTGLQTLDMRCCEVADISPLSTLTGLQTLNMRCCSHVADISPLSTLTGLQTLDTSCVEPPTLRLHY